MLSQYAKAEEYYSTAFHELTHSTMHASRCNRQSESTITRFGDSATPGRSSSPKSAAPWSAAASASRMKRPSRIQPPTSNHGSRPSRTTTRWSYGLPKKRKKQQGLSWGTLLTKSHVSGKDCRKTIPMLIYIPARGWHLGRDCFVIGTMSRNEPKWSDSFEQIRKFLFRLTIRLAEFLVGNDLPFLVQLQALFQFRTAIYHKRIYSLKIRSIEQDFYINRILSRQ